MGLAAELVCWACEASYPIDQARWRCDCGGLLDVRCQPAWDRGRITGRGLTLWRYREALPVRDDRHINARLRFRFGNATSCFGYSAET